MQKWSGRVAAAVVGAVAALALGSPAFAHVEVTAQPATGGAANAVITFSAEAESPSAGIASVRVVLPTGIAPGDVTLDKAPAGWSLTPGADGYTVGGNALPQGQEAVHSVKVAKLPNVAQLVFKTLVTYSDGSVDRWIDESAGAENPAPVLKLTVTAETTTAAAPTTTSAAPTTSAPAAAPVNDSGSNAWLWWLIAAVVVLLAVAGFLAMRRRRT